MSLMETDTESLIIQEVDQRRGWRAGLLAGAAGMVALVSTVGAAKLVVSSKMVGLQGKEERIDIKPSFAACSSFRENCITSGCCQVSGHTCFTKSNGIAQCNETCTPGKQGFTCGVVAQHSVPVDSILGGNLYCFSVYAKNTGNSKPSTELELLSKQMEHSVSIFSCEQWDVFSDVVEVVYAGYSTIKVDDSLGEFHQIKRKETNSWVNWGMFYQVWIKVREVGKWQSADYTVKVDPDAVFVPQRLRDYLGTKKGDSPHGVYYENCKNVQYGFFGNLEVISRAGTKVLTQYLEDCHAVFAPCANDGCDWKWGSWGEDVFAQRCMDHHYVDKVEAFDMTTDGACASDRPEDERKNKKWHAEDCSQVTSATAHPFKKPTEYFKCLGEMTGKTY